MKIFFKQVWCCVIVLSLSSCTGSEYPPASTALEACREFIDGCLKGDFKKASFYMIDDSINQSELLKIQRDYNSKSGE
jgi:hypothetical protein